MKRRILALLLCLGLLSGSAGAVLSAEDAKELVEQLYVYEIPAGMEEADTVEEVFALLDRYSNYFSPEEYQSFLNTMNDVSSVGVGIMTGLSRDGTCLEVLSAFEDGAAYAAGIRAGDFIVAVDGKLVSEAANLEEAGGWMRGEEGTRVTLSLKSAQGVPWSTTVTRKPFTISHTTHRLIDGHIGYLNCDAFGEETYGHFMKALDELEGEADHWILDLRDNSGGLASVAVDVVGIFNGPGAQTLMGDAQGQYYGYYADKERTTMHPVIVLLNGSSASASELAAAALRDKQAGLVIGGRTYGKGVAQIVVDETTEPELFADGDAVRITSYRFYSPNGLANEWIGVFPHLMVGPVHAQDIACLLSDSPPYASGEERLEVTLGSWRWNVDMEQALREEYRPAFVELLEALWPQSRTMLTTADGSILALTAAQVAERYGLSEYTPRGFEDAADSEYGFALDVLGTYGILLGDGTGKVNPKGELTRAQLCAMLAQLLNCGYTGPSQFTDVAAEDWYFSAVNAMAKLGFVEGDGTGAFYPEQVLTNEQMITVLARMAAWLGINFREAERQGPTPEELAHESLAAYSDWAREGVWLLGQSQRNLLGGSINHLWTDVENIVPEETALRETTAQSLYRTLNLMGILVP